jgi:hypothetical protein
MSDSNTSDPNNAPANTEPSLPVSQAGIDQTNASATGTPTPTTDTATADIPPDNSVNVTEEDVTVTITDNNAEFFKKVGSVVFQKSNALLLIWFLAIYILAYFVLGMFFGAGPDVSNFQKNLGRLVDLIFLGGLLVYAFVYYYYVPDGKFNKDLQSAYEETIRYLNQTMSLLTTTLFIATLYIIVYLFRIPMSSEAKPLFISLIENTAWIGLLLVAIISFFKHVLGVPLDDFFDKINPFGKAKEEEPTDLPPAPEQELPQDEVFNISNNLYTYDDAQAICSAFGAKIATYDQIESAYNKGAEWCSYGWSAEQMAFFPTQKNTWDNLQKNPTQKNNCGRPGVNGGYIANPYIKFGVNCYGKKPKPTDADMNRLDAKQNQVFPQSPADKELAEKVKYWKDNADKLLQINSYNTNQWSQY